jgi:hypothetical protein
MFSLRRDILYVMLCSKEEFLPCPVHPALLHKFGCCYIILMGHKKIKIKMNNSIDMIKINKKCFLYAETYYMLCFVQIRTNRYENRLIFLLLANTNIIPALLHKFGCCYIILMGHKKIKIKMNNSI